MSDATHGHGTTLTGATSGLIGNIINVSLSGRTRDWIDISTMDSTDKFREFLAGMADEGEISLEVNYDGKDAGVANALNTAFQAATQEVWTVAFPCTSTFACNGGISNLGIASDFEGKTTQPITIKLSGKGTFADVAPA